MKRNTELGPVPTELGEAVAIINSIYENGRAEHHLAEVPNVYKNRHFTYCYLSYISVNCS